MLSLVKKEGAEGERTLFPGSLSRAGSSGILRVLRRLPGVRPSRHMLYNRRLREGRSGGKGGGPSHHSSWHVPLSRDAGAKAPDTTLRHRATPKTSLPLRLPGRGRFERTLDFFVLFRF